jgi:methylmalonyl-CoA mutase N-terminal domain/subunit
MQLRMIAGGGAGGLTVQQPENNIIRGAYYALASALSGAQTMALCCYDEAYTIPSERATKLSLRTMEILMLETGVADTVDPLAGSYFVETTTNQMEERIVQIMNDLDEKGGIVQGVAEGRVQAEVNRQAYQRELKVAAGEIKKVGLNCFVEDEEERAIEFHPYSEEEAKKQVARLNRIKQERDNDAVQQALSQLRAAASGSDNVMPAAMNAVEEYATVGEVCGTLKEVFGAHQEPVRF